MKWILPLVIFLGFSLSTTAKDSTVNHGKYLFGNSAIPLNKGEGYYQNNVLAFNSGVYGLTNNISVGAGFELFSLTEFGYPIYQVHAGYSKSLSNIIHLSAGFYLINAYLIYPVSAQIRTKVTIGDNSQHMSFELRFGTFDDEFMPGPAFNISATSQVFGQTALVFESYFPRFYDFDEETFNITNFAYRINASKHQVDIGFSTSPIYWEFDIEMPVLPYLGYTYHFGKKS